MHFKPQRYQTAPKIRSGLSHDPRPRAAFLGRTRRGQLPSQLHGRAARAPAASPCRKAGRTRTKHGPDPDTPEVYGKTSKGFQSRASNSCNYQPKDAINNPADDTPARHAEH